MKTLHSVIAIGLVCCLLAFPLIEARALQEAQPPPEPGISDWNNLRQVRIGDKVEVVRHNLGKHKGKVLAWTEESISLRLKNQDVTIPREEVYRVTLLSKNHRLRNSMIGMGLGFLAAVAVVASRPEETSTYNALARAPVLIGIGAGVGAAFPSHPTLYRAPRREHEDGQQN